MTPHLKHRKYHFPPPAIAPIAMYHLPPLIPISFFICYHNLLSSCFHEC